MGGALLWRAVFYNSQKSESRGIVSPVYHLFSLYGKGLIMGMVFSWGDVLTRKIPSLEGFSWAVENARKMFAEDDSIVGAIVCGSVIRGDHNRRSDVDVFVLYDPELQEEAFRCMQKVTREAFGKYVPLVCLPCDTRIATTRMHHAGASFRQHLERSAIAGGLLKGNPLAFLADSVPDRLELESYLRVKFYNLQEAWSTAVTFSEERRMMYLKKLIEAPMHVARKVLAHRGFLDGDSKMRVRELYRERIPRLARQFEGFIRLDEVYSAELENQLREPDAHAYFRLLDIIAFSSEEVLDFIRANLMFVSETAP